MSRRATFTKAELNRVFKAARANGCEVVLPNGLRIVPEGLTATTDTPSPIDPLDAELAEWSAKHGYG